MNKEKLYNLYIERVNEISNDLESKTIFNPEEIIDIISSVIEDNFNEVVILPKVTRLEIIDHQGQEGRVYTKRNCEKVELSIQDEGRTLKIFISKDIKD
jgi:hypothetical protein